MAGSRVRWIPFSNWLAGEALQWSRTTRTACLEKYKGRQLGTLGSLSTLSFHHTKNISCGEGGALLLNQPDLAQRAEIIREKGTNRARFYRGEIDKYTWVDIGSSYLPSELNAAYLLGQLEARDVIQARRGRIWQRYSEAFSSLPSHRVTRPTIPAGCEQPYHLYYLLLPTLAERTEFIAFMRARKSEPRSTMFRSTPRLKGSCLVGMTANAR